MQVYNDEFYHHGILGMHWGHHKKVVESTNMQKTREEVLKNKKILKIAKQNKNKQTKYGLLTANKENLKTVNSAEREYRYSKEDLKKTKILEKLKTNGKNKKQVELETKYKKKGMSNDEASVAAYNHIRTKKVLMTIGAMTLTAAVVYGGHKYNEAAVDKIIKSGTKLQNIASEKDKGLHNNFYSSKNILDKIKYKGIYGSSIKSTGEGVVNKQIKVLSDIKQASPKNAKKVLSDLIKKDPKFAEGLTNLLKTNNYIDIENDKYKKTVSLAKKSLAKGIVDKNVYNVFNAGLVDHSPEMQKLTDKYFQTMTEKGYNAIKDVTDVKYSGFDSKNPIIVFNTINKVGLSSVKKLTEKEISKSNVIATTSIIGTAVVKQGSMIVGTLLGSKVIKSKMDESNANKKIIQYRNKNPKSKLTNTEIIRMIERNENY